MNKEKLREAATDLSKTAMELIQEILIKHDMALIEECSDILQERKRVRLIGYAHKYGVDLLPTYSERQTKWNTPISSMPFEGCVKVYVEDV